MAVKAASETAHLTKAVSWEHTRQKPERQIDSMNGQAASSTRECCRCCSPTWYDAALQFNKSRRLRLSANGEEEYLSAPVPGQSEWGVWSERPLPHG